MAMYAAKGKGKNRVESYDAGPDGVGVSLDPLRVDVGGAAQRDELVVEFQPVVDLASGALVGLEALVRWQHPTRGLLPPSAFIDLAERSGAIIGLGSWVLETATRQLHRWQRRYDVGELWVSVNVSASQLDGPGFVAGVEGVLRSTGLDAASLVLEVTESVLVDPRRWCGGGAGRPAVPGRPCRPRRLRHRLLLHRLPAPAAGGHAQDRRLLRHRHRRWQPGAHPARGHRGHGPPPGPRRRPRGHRAARRAAAPAGHGLPPGPGLPALPPPVDRRRRGPARRPPALPPHRARRRLGRHHRTTADRPVPRTSPDVRGPGRGRDDTLAVERLTPWGGRCGAGDTDPVGRRDPRPHAGGHRPPGPGGDGEPDHRLHRRRPPGPRARGAVPGPPPHRRLQRPAAPPGRLRHRRPRW